jgi:iron-sulfur cluster assembly accessory protein
METSISTPVNFTAKAIAELKRLLATDENAQGKLLRVGVKGGGCSGMTYILGFDDLQDGDETFEYDGLSCIMNKAHGIYLMQMEIDWADGLNSRGFTFNNPNASKTCGCGTSFAV